MLSVVDRFGDIPIPFSGWKWSASLKQLGIISGGEGHYDLAKADAQATSIDPGSLYNSK
jgi:hypothetical protein